MTRKLLKRLKDVFVGIEPLKARHDVTKLEFIVPLLSYLCINIDLNIQTHITYIVHDLGVLGVA